jgi:ABC-type glycerol-3-phosphate transport system permease component
MNTNRILGGILWYALLLVVIALSLGPIVWMMSTSFKPEGDIVTINIQWIPKTFTLENYRNVLVQYDMLRWTVNSLIVAIAATVLALLLSSLSGYALARMEFCGRNSIFLLIISMLFIPMQITVVPLFLLFSGFNLVDNYLALILPIGANVTPVFLMRQFFLNIPGELEDAARVDGANDWRIWAWIVMPLARPALTAVAIIVFLSTWNSFFWPLIVTQTDASRTLPVGLAQFMSLRPGMSMSAQAYGKSMAGAVLASIPPILVFFMLQRYFIEGVSKTGLKG